MDSLRAGFRLRPPRRTALGMTAVGGSYSYAPPGLWVDGNFYTPGLRRGATVLCPLRGLCGCDLKRALEAEDVDGGSPEGVGAGEAVGGPLVGFVEVLCAEVVDEGEEVGVAQRERDEMGAGGGDERDADAAAPGIGIDIEGGELAVMGKVGLMRGRCGGEAEDFFGGEGGDVPRRGRIGSMRRWRGRRCCGRCWRGCWFRWG